MVKSYDHVLSFALDHPWAITREMLSVIAGIIARRVAGEDTDPAVIEAALVNRKNLPQPRAGSIAIIPVYGVIAPRANLMSEMSGGTTFEKLTGQLRQAAQTKDIKTIVFDIDSPGGNVAGATEFAAELMKARKSKPIIAQAQYTMASAAYWPFAAATEIVAAPSARVGSLGVYTSHDDLSAALEQLGVKRTYISAGKGKVEGAPGSALSEQAQARIQGMVDEAYGQMVADVVKGRGAGMSAETVRNTWQAHVYGADEAKAIGMVDRIGTLDDTLARILSASPDAADQRAALAYMDSEDIETSGRVSATAIAPHLSDLDLERALFELTL